ncbi:MAG: hypothetical protein KDN22_29725, partial [Verrucomicrobiae bacterium]|nr:hypothetical protein [Verrucomicrobiae bacterium]
SASPATSVIQKLPRYAEPSANGTAGYAGYGFQNYRLDSTIDQRRGAAFTYFPRSRSELVTAQE